MPNHAVTKANRVPAAIQINDAFITASQPKNDVKVKEVAITLSIKDRKSTRLNSSHSQQSRMPSSA